MTYHISDQVTEIEKIVQKLIDERSFTSAREEINHLDNLLRRLSAKLKAKINKGNKGVFFEDDELLEKLELDLLIRDFFDMLHKDIGGYLFDEIAFMKISGLKMHPVYFYSIKPLYSDFNTKREQKKELDDLQNKLYSNLEFFIPNIENDEISEGQGFLAKNQEGSLFDIILKFSDYAIGFNNSEDSLEQFKKKFEITDNQVLHYVTDFYEQIKEAVYTKLNLVENS